MNVMPAWGFNPQILIIFGKIKGDGKSPEYIFFFCQILVYLLIARQTLLETDISLDGEESVLDIVEGHEIQQVEFFICLYQSFLCHFTVRDITGDRNNGTLPELIKFPGIN